MANTFKQNIPVHNINKDNIRLIRDDLIQCIKRAGFVAIDLEMTGLGIKVHSRSPINERYHAYKTLAETRSILSLGLSMFSKARVEEKQIKCDVTVFDVLLFEQESFTVDPTSLQFLLNHGLDFNEVIRKGIPFRKRSDDIPNRIFKCILESGTSIVLHNGLIDLMFLYNNFYRSLPSSSSEFLANLSDLFQPMDKPPVSDKYSASLIDTKYIADYKLQYPISYLEYLFRKARRQNIRESEDGGIHVDIHFELLDGGNVKWVESTVSDSFINKKYDPSVFKFICDSFSNHGFCAKKDKCPLDHDVELMLDQEEYKKIRKQDKGIKRKHDECEHPPKKLDKSEFRGRIGKNTNDLGCHSAGMDSYMTGFTCMFFCRDSLHLTQKCPLDYCSRLSTPSEHPLLIRTEQHIKRDDPHHQESLLLIRKARSLNHGEI